MAIKLIGRKNKKDKNNNEKNTEKIKKEKVGLVTRFRNLLKRIFYRFYNSRLGEIIKDLGEWLYKNIEKSIRFELMVVFAICFVSAFFFYGFANNMLAKNRTITNIEYDIGSIQSTANNIARDLSNNESVDGLSDKDTIESYLGNYNYSKAKIYITDLDGKILYKVNGDFQEKLDIYAVIDKSNTAINEGDEKVFLYPVNLGGDRAYLIYYETPTPYISNEYLL